jgi:hypothetical protein
MLACGSNAAHELMFRMRRFHGGFGTLSLISPDSTSARTPGKLPGDQKPCRKMPTFRAIAVAACVAATPVLAQNDPKACSEIVNDEARPPGSVLERLIGTQ